MSQESLGRRLWAFAPAKVNLTLAVTGRRDDGFHDLHSLVAPLDFGDFLSVELLGGEVYGDDADDELLCNDLSLSTGSDNLVQRAASAFRAEVRGLGRVRFKLLKQTPTGAGLGGGSSDGVAALRLLNELAGRPLNRAGLQRLATTFASDGPLFLAGGPCIMTGRGEVVTALSVDAARSLCGYRFLLAQPSFAVSTPWAYGKLAEAGAYTSLAEAKARVAAWCDRAIELPELLHNDFQPMLEAKFVVYRTLRELLWERLRLPLHITGSGSAFLIPVENPAQREAASVAIREALGPRAFLREVGFGRH